MRTIIKRSVVLAGFIAAISGTAFADPSRQEVKVPFEFTVNGQTLPAGTYSIERPRDMEGSAVLIQGEGSKRTALYALIRPGDDRTSDDAVVFTKDGGQYRLTQVGNWVIAD